MSAVILQRVFWGDYGSILMHGEAFVRSEFDADLEVPTGTIVYQAILPSPLVVFPTGFFICHTTIRTLLESEFPSVKFAPVYLRTAVSVPWRSWVRKGKCKIPRTGEPEDFFNEYEIEEDFTPGFSPNYWSLEVDDFVLIDKFVEAGTIPKALNSIPDKPFVWGGLKPGVRGCRALFCNPRVVDVLWDYREVLDMFVLD